MGPEDSLRQKQMRDKADDGAATILEAVAFSLGIWGVDKSRYLHETSAVEEAFLIACFELVMGVLPSQPDEDPTKVK